MSCSATAANLIHKQRNFPHYEVLAVDAHPVPTRPSDDSPAAHGKPLQLLLHRVPQLLPSDPLAVVGARWHDVDVNNQVVNISGHDKFFIPSVGLRLQRVTPAATTQGSLSYEWTCRRRRYRLLRAGHAPPARDGCLMASGEVERAPVVLPRPGSPRRSGTCSIRRRRCGIRQSSHSARRRTTRGNGPGNCKRR